MGSEGRRRGARRAEPEGATTPAPPADESAGDTSRSSESGLRNSARALALPALGMTLAVAAWGYLVWAAIDFGRTARDGDTSALPFLGLACLGAVACLFVGLMLLARLVRTLTALPGARPATESVEDSTATSGPAVVPATQTVEGGWDATTVLENPYVTPTPPTPPTPTPVTAAEPTQPAPRVETNGHRSAGHRAAGHRSAGHRGWRHSSPGGADTTAEQPAVSDETQALPVVRRTPPGGRRKK
ncbi:hypothetical protein [Nocardioides sp. GY 10127]|uniref:hypothetical protein n=1 Tax=Nocardioides sp. GY 10127 TaxID=2569762 RepID=UPI0010A780F0|nr:hypothetical protein [Nocardioides sp. GY 10127]TIC84453.1 hypothetical protein E8D37_06735 [Nocardioides sp. GY 10127]